MWDLDWKALLTFAAPIGAAFVAGWWAWIQGKKKAGIEAQGAINSGFQMLVTELQEERVKLTEVVDKQSSIIASQSSKIVGLENEVRRLIRHIDRLEKAMTNSDIQFPALPNEE